MGDGGLPLKQPTAKTNCYLAIHFSFSVQDAPNTSAANTPADNLIIQFFLQSLGTFLLNRSRKFARTWILPSGGTLHGDGHTH